MSSSSSPTSSVSTSKKSMNWKRRIRLLIVVVVTCEVCASLLFGTYCTLCIYKEHQPIQSMIYKKLTATAAVWEDSSPTEQRVMIRRDSQESQQELEKHYNTSDDDSRVQQLLLQAKQQAAVIVGRRHQDDKDWVIAMISMGRVARDDYYTERCVRSIRVRGNYNGYILVMTDEAGKKKYDQTLAWDSRVIVMQARDEDIHPTTSGKKTIRYKDRKMIYKRFKTLLWQYLEYDKRLTAAKRLLYVDIDIVIGKELHPFFEWYQTNVTSWIESTIDDKTSFISTFSDPNPARRHGGLLVFDRKYSSGCLKAWRSRMDEDGRVIDRDQTLLMQVLNNVPRYHCIYHDLKKSHMLFPMLIDLEQRRYRTFVHVARTGRARKIDSSTQEKYFHDALLLGGGELLYGNTTWEEALRVNFTNK